MNDGRFLVELVGGVPVVATPREIDITDSARLQSALLEAAAYGHGTIVVDMSRTQFCDCSGLGALLAAHDRARADGGQMLLAISGGSVLRIFTITGTDRIIRSFTTLDEALGHASADATRPDGSPTAHPEDSAA
jgi:anti-sigma B factor antagonist